MPVSGYFSRLNRISTRLQDTVAGLADIDKSQARCGGLMERMAGTVRNTAVVAARVDAATLPLCVDLDGTLLVTDSLQEAAVAACLADPRVVLALPGWLAQGKARFKEELARRWDFDPAQLPYHLEFLTISRSRKRRAAGSCWRPRPIAGSP